jgi:uncharacterized membrane protein YkoI
MKIRTLGISSALLVASLMICRAEDDDGVSLDQAPAAVQQTIKEVVGNGKIKEIEKEAKDGTVTYEVDYKSANGDKQEAVISADGKLLKNGADTEKDEAPENGKDGKGGEDKD